jgi:transcriptional regulator with XRE-family HTH domain
MNELANNLKLLREDRKYTKKEIAELIGTTWHSYKNWENGRYIPTLPSLINLSKVYNISLDELVGLKEIKESNLINKGIYVENTENEETK